MLCLKNINFIPKFYAIIRLLFAFTVDKGVGGVYNNISCARNNYNKEALCSLLKKVKNYSLGDIWLPF